ncbi:hypothetical protein BAUCODRAFT_102765 [Baudoinia panamericana UAMH 10762]|uniref:SGT1-domain-containing protein n=1 Tax=Baudoinia panamericana (strain UAMH 10762) TaxID=717646 RepID=M2MTQ1_BAUPA|nr:uncharacterized protein BAUCODRAFT_102765 [Baudoinia panamericana UAMH 10762]EMD00292.1 hypothetical protein BAUCODRAFT_102765 [Baudoinia panamericana UAMH 10762]
MDEGAPHDEGLKWFGEGFDGFPKRLPEDCVEYVIYVINEHFQDVAATRARLNAIFKKANEICRKHTAGYIWQRGEFDLKIRPTLSDQEAANGQKSSPQTPHLRGRTDFGDSIADEWLVVYLLLELSKQCPDAWIRVYDTDGEFLLIEAANALPKWLSPDVSESRVWINNGHLRIVPLDEGSRTRSLSLQDALTFVRKSPDKLIVSPFIEEEAFYRLRTYPGAIATSMHRALITVPRPLAYLLHRKPTYISPAIEAFYLRDPISLKPLATKDTATLHLPPEDFVTVSVKFTKVGYAQLRSQLFDTPPAWTGIIPRLSDSKVELGMKLACGFEMLLTDPQSQDKRVVREIKLLLNDIESGEEPLPSDVELASWPRDQDDEKWLDIDYRDFEHELSGKKGGNKTAEGGFGDQGAQDNLRKMVSRFEDFLNDDSAGVEGIDDGEVSDDDADEPDEEVSDLDSGEDRDAGYDDADFERAMKEMMGMPAEEVEKSGLLEEARRLALEDEQSGDEPDEDEEMKKVMELMEQELKGHDALRTKHDTHNGVDEDEDVGPGDEELSSDDEEFNDIDLGLAKNMLESFKGQAGLAGPAGNIMRALGINMPRDEGGEE